MTHIRTAIAVLVSIAVLLPSASDAQVFGREGARGRGGIGIRPGVDVRGLYSTKYDEFGVGGRLRFLLGPGVELAPGFDYFFVESESGEDFGEAWNLSADILINLVAGLYVGGGFAYTRTVPPVTLGGKTEAGTEVLVGWALGPRRRYVPRVYGESKWIFSGSSFVGSRTLQQFGFGLSMQF